MPRNATETELSPKQLKAIEALATGTSMETAAKHSGVHSRTIGRWMKLPDFEKALAQYKRDVWNRSIAFAVVSSNAAVKVLRDICTDETNPPGARIQAASKLIETARSGFIEMDLADRLQALEDSASEQEH